MVRQAMAVDYSWNSISEQGFCNKPEFSRINNMCISVYHVGHIDKRSKHTLADGVHFFLHRVNGLLSFAHSNKLVITSYIQVTKLLKFHCHITNL